MKKVLLALVLVVAGINLAMVEDIPYTDSGSELGKIVEIKTTGSVSNKKVVIEEGEKVEFQIKYEARTDILGGTIQVKCYLHIGNASISIPIKFQPFQNLEKGKTYLYTVNINIPKNYPSIESATLRIKFTSETPSGTIISFNVPVTIKGKNSEETSK